MVSSLRIGLPAITKKVFEKTRGDHDPEFYFYFQFVSNILKVYIKESSITLYEQSFFGPLKPNQMLLIVTLTIEDFKKG